MQKRPIFKQVYEDFKKLCADGLQTCSFSAYCLGRGMDYKAVAQSLRLAGQPMKINDIPGYKRMRKKSIGDIGQLCSKVYDDFKRLCAEGRQPSSFIDYYKSFGIEYEQMRRFQKKNNLRVASLPGFTPLTAPWALPVKEMPFEDIIFEESGFLPANESSSITIKVDGHVAVSFPATTDLDAIAMFIRKIRKEGSHVGA